MSLTDFYRKLGAPLTNNRWSWGSTMQDGTVLLRVWQDRVEKIDGKRYVVVANHNIEAYTPNNLGYKERLDHLRTASAGSNCLLIMCLAKDPEVNPRSIKSYNKNYVFVGGTTIEKDERTYMEIVDKISVDKII